METVQQFCAISFLVVLHLFGNAVSSLDWVWKGRILSFASGVSVAYVFIELLPELSNSQNVIHSITGTLPFFEHHVYILALLGLLFFYGMEQLSQTFEEKKENIHFSFWIRLSSVLLFNFLVGYALADKHNPDIQPLILFTIAMGLHYFINDHALKEVNAELFNRYGRFLLAFSIILGFIFGLMTEIPAAAIALVVAFIAGGVIINVFRHELPVDKPHSFGSFTLGALIYTPILLFIGK